MASDLLAGIPLFAKLREADRLELAGLLRSQTFPANQPIFWLGERGDDFYIIREGKVTVSCPDETGKEVLLATLGPGHFFGEISLLDGGPRTATIRALTDAHLSCLGREAFLQFLEGHPAAAVHMLGVLGQRQRETMDKVRGIRNANEVVAQETSRWQRIAERIAGLSASEYFVAFNLVFFGAWIIINLILKWMHREPFDDAPFGLLGFIVTIEALFISLFVLISQAQQGVRDRVRADLDYQVNLKAHQEVMQLHQKVDRLSAALKDLPKSHPQMPSARMATPAGRSSGAEPQDGAPAAIVADDAR